MSVRGCVRVTGVGVESVVEGCEKLEAFDVSQCRNLVPWIDGGGREKIWQSGRNVKFCVWAGEEGEWGTTEKEHKDKEKPIVALTAATKPNEADDAKKDEMVLG